MIFTKPYADALIVLLVILLFFGPKRLPALGRSLGDGLREFKDSIGGKSKDADEKPELESAPSNQSAVANSAPEREPAAQAAAPAEPTEAETSSQPRS